MTCPICGNLVLTGDALGGKGGSYLIESSCHDGVWMDDDEWAEGWKKDVLYSPCPNNPQCCTGCAGSGVIREEDCPACEGTGWIGEIPEWLSSSRIDEGR